MFDPKCYALAEHFLPADASEDLKSKFAQDVQDHIELMYPEPERVDRQHGLRTETAAAMQDLADIDRDLI